MNFEKPNIGNNTVMRNNVIDCDDNDFSNKLISGEMNYSDELKSDLITYDKELYKVERFICQECLLDGKEFSCTQRSNLVEHMHIHRANKHVTIKIQTDNIKVNAVTCEERIVSRDEEIRLYCMTCRKDFNEADLVGHTCKGSLGRDNFTCLRPFCSGICKCPVCGRYFTKFAHLNHHIHSCHLPHSESKLISSVSNMDTKSVTRNTTMALVCRLCDGFSASNTELNRAELNHHFGSHKDVKLYKYKLCYKATETDVNDLKERVLLEFEQVQFYCKDCKRDFLSEEEFNDHEIRHTIIINCPLCEVQISEAAILVHVENMHKSERFCNIFKKKYDHYRNFIEHLLSCHTSGHTYKCVLCKKYFAHFQIFQSHVKLRHTLTTTRRAQVCYVCGAKYSNYGALKFHIGSHDSDLPKCDHCQKTFTQMGNLRSHISIHFQIGGPAHTCVLCKKSFRTATYLKSHTKQVHTKDLPFMCDKCGYLAPSKDNLRFHMNVHSVTKQFQCKNCKVRFRWPHNLKTHLRKRVCTNI